MARFFRATGTFRSLRNYNYRLWAAGALVSNVGTWMQRVAQDWLVLTQLTHNNASAVGLVMALQFGPQMLMLPFSGFAADFFDRRRLLMTTQAAMGLCALVLGLLAITDLVQLWHVYVIAFCHGTAAAFDAPARQTFVADLVGEVDLPNAVALNSTSFNAARMVGPAVAGLLIATVGTGWAFLLNALSFGGVLCSLTFLHLGDLHPSRRASRAPGGFVAGFRYVWARPDLRAILLMLFLIGTFGMNFQLYISAMAVKVFHTDAGGYGLLASMMAVGTVTGALLAAGREKPRIELLLSGAAVFAVGCGLAAIMPNYWLFGATLVVIGISALTITNSTNSLMQISTEPAMRGRVMAIRLAIAMGGTPIGAPLVGWVADRFGPRWALGVGAAAGFLAAIVMIFYLTRYRELRVSFAGGRVRLSVNEGASSSAAGSS